MFANDGIRISYRLDILMDSVYQIEELAETLINEEASTPREADEIAYYLQIVAEKIKKLSKKANKKKKELIKEME